MCGKRPEKGKYLRFRDCVVLGKTKMEPPQGTCQTRVEGDPLFLRGFLGHAQISEFYPRANSNLAEDFGQCRAYLALS